MWAWWVEIYLPNCRRTSQRASMPCWPSRAGKYSTALFLGTGSDHVQQRRRPDVPFSRQNPRLAFFAPRRPEPFDQWPGGAYHQAMIAPLQVAGTNLGGGQAVRLPPGRPGVPPGFRREITFQFRSQGGVNRVQLQRGRCTQVPALRLNRETDNPL